MGSILAVAAMPFSMISCRVESRFSGVGAKGSIVFAMCSCGVVMEIDITVGVRLKMSRSLMTWFDFVTISRGKPCLARV